MQDGSSAVAKGGARLFHSTMHVSLLLSMANVSAQILAAKVRWPVQGNVVCGLRGDGSEQICSQTSGKKLKVNLVKPAEIPRRKF